MGLLFLPSSGFILYAPLALRVAGLRTGLRFLTDEDRQRTLQDLRGRPEWVFELAGLPSPGKSTLRSITVKALERRADGVVVPERPDLPLTVVEFQFQADDTIYRRTVVEMAAVRTLSPDGWCRV